MSELKVMECMKSLKIKNVEKYDRIPQRILVDGLEILKILILYSIIDQADMLGSITTVKYINVNFDIYLVDSALWFFNYSSLG